MLKKLGTATAAIYNAVDYQLKAYYVGHFDKNVSKLRDTLGIESTSIDLMVFPEWVAPLCSIFAALFAISKLAVACKNYLVGLFKKR